MFDYTTLCAFIIIFIITSLHLYCRMIDDYKRRVDVVGVFIYNYTYLDLVLAQWSVLERAKQVKGQQALHCFALQHC